MSYKLNVFTGQLDIVNSLSIQVTEIAPYYYNQIADIEESMLDDRIDLGAAVGTNPNGYYRDYLTNKTLYHSSIGVNDTSIDGGLGYEDGRPFYWKSNRKQDVLIGIDIRESENSSISYYPFESNYAFFIHSGDTHSVGVDGIPIIQSYVNVSMGAHGQNEIIDGGSF